MQGQATNRLTYDDYVLIPDDGLRHEIIDGEHFVNPSPNIRHQRISRRIFMAIANFVEKHDLGEVFYSPLDVVFSRHNVVQPDVLFIRKETLGEVFGPFVKVTPDLTVEVLSISNRRYDEVKKLSLYDQFNVQEYWIADPEDNVVNVYRRKNAGLTLVEKVGIEGTVTSPLFPEFALSGDKIFT